MQRNLERRVRQRLARFVTGQESLRKFNAWFIPATWDVDQAAASLRDLVYGVKARLDEYDDGYVTKDQLKQKLSLILQSYRLFNENIAANSSSRNFILANASSRRGVFPVRRGAQYQAAPPQGLSVACA